MRQASKAASFKEAREDLQALAEVSISATHLQRLSQRVGREWAQARDQEVQAFRQDKLLCAYAAAPKAAAVMLDGGRVQTRAEERGPGVHDPRWRETKVACCLSLASQEQADDPQPEPPSKFLDAEQVAQLAAEVKRRSRPALARAPATSAPPRGRKPRRRRASRKRVRTVVASMADSETFGWQMAAEVQRRGLDRAARKACVCDGQHYNWTLFAMHLLPWGFIGILDFVHLLSYLHDAAHAWKKDRARAWKQYVQWLRWAWSGQVKPLLASLRKATSELGKPPADAADTDPRKIVQETLGYVHNNRSRMDYPRYRRLGLPTSSAPVESTIKQLNRRVKGSEKFWLNGGAEALLQVRAAYLSEDDRASAYWARPRPYARAAGGGRLRVTG
ncbi:MAG: LysR family transcriptional regulator [Candidatus Eremiobacteraeota bacterium]|nr:LysR family transcriptional regulator [Candidatus Eremiobacteraeota bacterium]